MSGTLAIVGYDYDLEEMEKDVPLCSMEEFASRLRSREDIFLVDKDRLLRNIETICIILAVISGIWLSHQTYIKHNTPEAHTFIQELKNGRQVNVRTMEIDRKDIMPQEKPKEIEKPKQLHARRKPRVNGDGRRNGGGDYRERKATDKGVLGIIAGLVEGTKIAYSDPDAHGGYQKKIDALLAGTGGLKKGSNSGTGRKGVAAIGHGPGTSSGFNEGTGGVDDLINSLMGPDEGALDLKTRPISDIEIKIPDGGGLMTGGRSRASITRVVLQNMNALRYAYNKRLNMKPNLRGKVTVKFAIDEFGKVIFCDVIGGTLNDPALEKTISKKIERWVFDKINKPGDVTEVVYPFVFSI